MCNSTTFESVTKRFSLITMLHLKTGRVLKVMFQLKILYNLNSKRSLDTLLFEECSPFEISDY